MAQRIQLRRDTAAAWTLANPTLAEGEFAVNTDTGQVKVGDGTTAWSALAYLEGTGGGGGIADFTGAALLGRSEVGVSGPYETLDAATVQGMLGYALVTSTDVDEATLSTVGAEIADHAGEAGDTGNVVHGIRPPLVLQANLSHQRYQLYENPTTPVTTVVGGFAPSGEVEVWAIHTGANKGLYYRDEDTTAQRLAPLTEYTPEQGYAEITSNFSTTNVAAPTSALITGLSVTVTGTGRPVDVRFSAPSCRHSVADTLVVIGLVAGGVLGRTHNAFSRSTSQGSGVEFGDRLVLTDGVSYTFAVGVQGGAAGTSLVGASATARCYLIVTER